MGKHDDLAECSLEIFFGGNDWECKLGDSSSVFTDSGVVVGVPVVINLACSSLDGRHVVEDVCVSGLVDLHLTLGHPVAVPGFDHFPVSPHVWAATQRCCEFWKIGLDHLESSKDLLVVLSGESVGGSAHVSRELSRWLEAGFEIGAMI